MSQLYELLEDIASRSSSLSGRDVFAEWTGSLGFVEDLIKEVENIYTRTMFKEKYMKVLSQARKVPIDRAQSFPVFKKLLISLSETTVDLEQKARDELQTIANPGFVVPHDGITQEEIKKLEDERKAKKADWYKATKKKPKTDDEEQQEAEEIRVKTAAGLKQDLLTARLTKVGREIEILRTKWLMDNHDIMDAKQFDDLLHLESVLDIDIAGKDLIVRLDLDVPLSEYVAPPVDSLGASGQPTDEALKSNGSKSALGGKKGGKNQEAASTKPTANEPWRKREILDHTLIKRGVHELRYL